MEPYLKSVSVFFLWHQNMIHTWQSVPGSPLYSRPEFLHKRTTFGGNDKLKVKQKLPWLIIFSYHDVLWLIEKQDWKQICFAFIF